MAGVTVKDVPAQDFINAYASFLQRQGTLDIPGYVEVVKTGTGKELPPQDTAGWFYKRAASIARHVYLHKDIGVGRLNKRYGSTINRGSRPSHHRDASGSINRKALQALQKLDIVEISETKGRRVTENGQRDLDRIAHQTWSELYENEEEEEEEKEDEE